MLGIQNCEQIQRKTAGRKQAGETQSKPHVSSLSTYPGLVVIGTSRGEPSKPLSCSCRELRMRLV